jgi:hypothetical protein
MPAVGAVGLVFNDQHSKRSTRDELKRQFVFVRVIPVRSTHVIGRKIVGTLKTFARGHVTRDVVGISITGDVQTMSVQIGDIATCREVFVGVGNTASLWLKV